MNGVLYWVVVSCVEVITAAVEDPAFWVGRCRSFQALA